MGQFVAERNKVESYFYELMHTQNAVYQTLDLTINGATKTVSRPSGSFITDSVISGAFIQLAGFVNLGNNNIFEVSAVAAGVLTLLDPFGLLTTEVKIAATYSYPSIPIAFENVAFNPPGPDKFFVTCYVVEGEGEQITLGNNAVFRYVGIIQNSIIGPEGVGTVPFAALADRIDSIWRRAQFSDSNGGVFTCGVTSLAPLDYRTYARLGAREGKYRLDVTTPYHRDIQ